MDQVDPPRPATRFLFKARTLGGHVHVHIWAGTHSQAEQNARPKLGHLIMDPGQWDAFQALLVSDFDGAQYRYEIVDDADPEARSLRSVQPLRSRPAK